MESKTNNKRSRSSNWTESEKAVLKQLIKEKIHIIENKDVTKNNNQIKKTAWQKILQSFNEINETKRDITQLITQWRNTKNNIKKRNYEYRRNCNATGGGPPPPSPPPEDVEIMEMIPNEFEIDNNVFDSDSLYVKKDHEAKESIVIIDITQPSCSDASLPTQTEKGNKSIHSGCPSASLPTQTEPSTQEDTKVPNKRVIKKPKKKVTQETSQSKELFELAKCSREQQMKYQEVEHKLKMNIMEKEHRIRLEIMEKEMEYWKKKLSELKE